MKIYNVYGYLLILAYAAACMVFAPAHFGPWVGLAIGAAYFVGCWFVGGLYLSSVIHMGIAHRALDYQPWFLKSLTVFNNTFGVYINPVTWTNRHRLHHKFADHPGDPNKLAADGFWRTLYLCLFPYRCEDNLANDAIFRSWSFRLVSNPVYAVVSQVFNFWLLWLLVGDARFAAAMWIAFRVFAVWINMVQNYWTHDRRWGYRRYDDRDNAMNIGDWLPVTATFSACLQNNHHHSPGLLRLSHAESEYDFGFLTVKAMKALGLVRATDKGTHIPRECPLPSLDF
ncbi:MAG TPA: fatty acid desaturase [Xanthomonadaceae bacterium]|jgi:stearoyl-CoA desaturase (delta-9 desaturase)